VPRRRRQQGLERVLGTPALFATAYGNVGSSIYYALGVTAVFALGLTPLVFIVAGLIFALTAATYAEGTVRYPEAGGSASFARHAFNELVSFGAGWAQLLVYVATVTTSAFFVPHYLSIFWEPLRENPWDVVGGIVVVVVLVLLNVVGVQEAAKLNVLLAVIDFATQLLLVLLGFVLVFSPEILVDNVHWGVAPTWANLAIAVPVAMLAYTGVETVSNLAEEVRDPAQSVPNAYKLVAGAVFAIYFTLPWIALSAMPVVERDGEFVTSLGLPPEEGGYANDPVLGVVQNMGLGGWVLEAAEVYVGVLAATILVIATNAGVIGASRITYSMATYRQLPERLRRLHPTFKTPWLALVIFAGIAPIIVMLPGDTTFIGTLYAFGATLSFTIAHAAIVRLRASEPNAELAFRARPNLRWRGVDWPLFALLGGIATGISWLVIVVQEAAIRWAGLGWLVLGLVLYLFYRRRFVRASLRETVRAPALVLGPSLTAEYRTIVVPLVRSPESEEALVTAARLASDRRATIVILHVLEVPLDRPLDADLGAIQDRADRLLDDAQAFVEEYGVRAVTRLVRARTIGRAIVDEATARNAELIVLGAPRRIYASARILGRTADYVLKTSPVRVLLTAGRLAA
jgi:basic amino acid/polyamine antiporter, APA family